jgi:hypothetical protein
MEIRRLKLTPKFSVALLLMAIGVLFRVLPHEPNFAPVGAIALFGGVVLGWRTAIWLPLAIMAITDMFLGFYPGMSYTWAGFVLVSVVGMCLRNSRFLTRVLLGALGSGIVFFAVSNFGVWASSGMYPHTLGGLAHCYAMALPFLRTSLLADLFYSFVLFGLYEFVARFIDARKTSSQFLHVR